MSFRPWRVTKEVGTERDRLDGLVTVSGAVGNVTHLVHQIEINVRLAYSWRSMACMHNQSLTYPCESDISDESPS